MSKQREYLNDLEQKRNDYLEAISCIEDSSLKDTIKIIA